ncbi:hypothetical protein niasHT_020379 [Heterodera trifolii]|uniref:Uncharacterized protein n=1 Tax=Heterodera trifolii TaxID=157864 RepID=A0ABD2JXU4_9BILA
MPIGRRWMPKSNRWWKIANRAKWKQRHQAKAIKTPAEMFLGRKPRTTLDLLRPPPSQPIERDAEMARRFNKRFGTKLREFSVGNKVFARHRISQNWQQGKVSNVVFTTWHFVFEEQREIPVEMPLEDPHGEQENLGGQIDHGQQRRYPQRNCRPPQRFSP